MKNSNSKRNDLIGAILSRDKSKLKKVLQEGKPEKWLCIELDYEKITIKADSKIVTEEEVKEIIKGFEKDFCVKLIVMRFNVKKNEGRTENWTFLTNCSELDLNWTEVTLKL